MYDSANDDTSYRYPRIPQVYKHAVGIVKGLFFYVRYGHGAQPGRELPLIYLVAERPGTARGRPPSKRANRKTAPPERDAYGLDSAEQWWAVRVARDGSAKARTIQRMPYATLGASLPDGRRRTRAPKWQKQAKAALENEYMAMLRQRCDLL